VATLVEWNIGIEEHALQETERRLILLEKKAEELEQRKTSPKRSGFLLLIASNILMGLTLVFLTLQARL
jgi:hypothetical protein